MLPSETFQDRQRINHFLAIFSSLLYFQLKYLFIPDINVDNHVVTALDAADVVCLANKYLALPASKADVMR